MGWSSPGSRPPGIGFNYDFHVTFDDPEGSVDYNYSKAGRWLRRREAWTPKGHDSPA